MASTSTTSMRTYRDAIDKLNSLQSNAQVIESIRKSGGKGGEHQMVEGVEYLKRIGYKPSDLDRLNVLHITGTKGKGSTSAFTDSVLRTIAPQAKTGLYTSPHLVAVRERIRINGRPIEEDLFAKYFFEVWDRLERDTERADPATPEKPAYFRYLTIMAFHVFIQEKVDATILEVGVGGTYDSTNVVPQPIVTGVTSLGIDHVFVLGRTLPEIAHQKGGIYKPGVSALAVDQPAEGLDVLRSRAAELKASSFTVVPELAQLHNVKLGLAGAHQRINASLAVALVQTFLASPRLPSAYSALALPAAQHSQLPLQLVAPNPLPQGIVKGLEQTRWPGRCQVEKDARAGSDMIWYLDGAHTVESLKCCGDWFAETALANQSKKKRALVFNCTSGRSGHSLLSTFSGQSKGDLTSNAIDASDLSNLTVQHELADAWQDLTSTTLPTSAAQVHILPSIEDAVELVRREECKDVLVTGSLHLIGGVMEVAQLPL
ncbi:Folylpolyglutamate synthetase [Microbotryomycetes sp. JL221]|nr:Folylpolyglutamate synthetase [Microbotryomycetes sp. JL221]